MVTVHSAIKPRGWSPLAEVVGGALFTSATVAAFFGSTVNHCSESLIFCVKRSPVLERCSHEFR